MKYICIGCKAEFKQKSNLITHRNRKKPCTDEKNVILEVMIEFQELNKKINKYRKNMSILQKEIKILQQKNIEMNKENEIQNKLIRELNKKQRLTITNNSTHNDNSTHTDNSTKIENNVTLVNIGQENLHHIMNVLENDLTSIITDNPVESLNNCMEKIYWHEETPENRIIGYDKDNDCLLIHKDGKWISKKGSFIIKNIKPFFENLEMLIDADYDKYKDLRPAFNMSPFIPLSSSDYKKKNINKFNKKILETAEKFNIQKYDVV